MNICRNSVLILIALLSLSACASNSPKTNKVVGAATGAAAGAALGAGAYGGAGYGPAAMVATGAIVGAFIGSAYGPDMDDSDKAKAYQAIAAGKSASWANSNTKTSYSIRPAASCITHDGNHQCRQFSASQTIDDKTRTIFRMACKEADGGWHIAH